MKALSKILLSGLTAAALLTVAGCATESNRALPVEQVASANVAYSGVRVPIAVGKFDNRSSYMRGIFSDGVDRLGGQAKTILITHLQQTNRFSVLDRDNMGEISQEAAIKGTAQKLKGADYVVTGDVTEFGRKRNRRPPVVRHPRPWQDPSGLRQSRVEYRQHQHVRSGVFHPGRR